MNTITILITVIVLCVSFIIGCILVSISKEDKEKEDIEQIEFLKNNKKIR